ncbi:hypothetical protein Bbelb_150280 [Branchiostoma belcheri]|nr:hypothetical protein Bbelb_150280 [Branchiostoma belcheri]
MATPGLSIVVSGLPDFPTAETAKDKITLYFQNRSQSSGGDVKNVGVNTATRQAVVTFEEQSVAQNVLAQPVHTLNNTQVQQALREMGTPIHLSHHSKDSIPICCYRLPHSIHLSTHNNHLLNLTNHLLTHNNHLLTHNNHL